MVGGGGGGWWFTVNLVFCFGPKLWFWTWTKLNNKSMGFDLSATRSCFSLLLFSSWLPLLPVDTKTGGKPIQISTQVIFYKKEFKAMETENEFTCHETNFCV